MEYDYNSNRKKLVLPEYGRNIQIMVDHVLSIEDREERNKAARTVIAVMGNLNPHLRDINDFKHKLWDHLALISDFNLDIDSPYELPAKEVLNEKPRTVPYNQHGITYKHYGRAIQVMIKKAIEMEDEEEKADLTKMIANHMKKSYLTWNREAVSDDEIFHDLRVLSNGKLNVDEDMQLSETRDILAKNRRRKGGGKKK